MRSPASIRRKQEGEAPAEPLNLEARREPRPPGFCSYRVAIKESILAKNLVPIRMTAVPLFICMKPLFGLPDRNSAQLFFLVFSVGQLIVLRRAK